MGIFDYAPAFRQAFAPRTAFVHERSASRSPFPFPFRDLQRPVSAMRLTTARPAPTATPCRCEDRPKPGTRRA